MIIDSRSGTEHLVTYIGCNEDEWVKDDRIREIGSDWRYSRGGKTDVPALVLLCLFVVTAIFLLGN